MDVEIRSVTASELPEVVAAVSTSWGHQSSEDDIEDARTIAELDRTFAAFDRGRPVAVAAVISFRLTLPGGTACAAGGFTEVGVVPTHRRRGLLTALMARQAEDARARAEPVSILVASEGGIYSRFGYGAAILAMAAELDPRQSAFARPPEAPGELRLLGPEECALLVPDAYDRYRRSQPGEVSRSEAHWEVLFRDRPRWRDGGSSRFTVAHESPGGEVDGYATYRVRAGWPQGLPAFDLDVEEVVATRPEVRAALWRYLLDIDLVGAVRAWNIALDDPLRWLLRDPRALRVTGVRDLLWLRVNDVPAALAARSYSGPPTRLVLDVGGDRYLLETGEDGAGCRPGPDLTPDLALRLPELGAVFLGGVPVASLARAGRVVEHTPGALAAAGRLLASDPPPHSVTDF